jgi:hypothetical protein
MTATDPNRTVVVTSEETLPGIADQLREAARGGHAVNLVVPIDSALLLTAGEFRTLKDAIDADRLPVVLRTADPLRLQLAARLGVRAEAMPRPRPKAAAVIPAPPAAPDTKPIDAPNGDWPGELVGVESPPTVDPASHWPALNGEGEPSELDAVSEEPAGAMPSEPSSNPPRRWLPVAALLVVLVLGTLLAIRFALPRAVITIVPRTAPVTASLTFDVAADGQPLDDDAAFAVPRQERTLDVVWRGTAPATGVRTVPDQTAGGPIELRNTSPESLTVAAGEIVASVGGREFAMVEDVTVPPADAATGEPGAATGAVRAMEPGSGGNVGNGEISGRLPNGVYYSNRMAPTDGGTDKEFPLIAEADLEGLIVQARAAAPDLAAHLLAEEDDGVAIVPSSVTVTDQTDSFDRRVGDEAESVSLESTLTLEIVTFDGDGAAEAYEEALLTRLQESAPDGFAVDPAAVRFEAPADVAASDGGIRMEVAARADAVAVLDEGERAALAEALAGLSPDAAAAVLADTPEIADFSVEYHPPFLPRQMPGAAARIELETAR